MKTLDALPWRGTTPSRTVDRCRMCGSDRLLRALDLGRTPLANSYLAAADLDQPELDEELCLQLCRECGLLQLTKVVDPDLMFRHYLYISSTTTTIREHFAELAATSARDAGAEPGELAIDIASNDGTLLKGFAAVGLQPLGVDPAENLAAEANAQGLETICAYWTPELARQIVAQRGPARLITACNVFAHADELNDFVAAVGIALGPRGLFVIEVPWVVDFLEKSEFDTAYHEHLSYVGITPTARLMARHGFSVVDVEHFPSIHGGTVRITCAREGERPAKPAVAELLERERRLGILDPALYQRLAARVHDNKRRLVDLVKRLRADGLTVWAYGASAKGNTLMNFFGLTAKDIPCAIDDNAKKWGLYTPGAHMKIVGIEALQRARVDVLLLLAWNFEREIRNRCRAAGYAGRFLVPIPEARLVEGG